eukprot:3547910-Pleurochrysis_carterae.AAC.1
MEMNTSYTTCNHRRYIEVSYLNSIQNTVAKVLHPPPPHEYVTDGNPVGSSRIIRGSAESHNFRTHHALDMDMSKASSS